MWWAICDIRMKLYGFSLKIFENCWISLVQKASGEFTGWINNATLHITHWTKARGTAQIQKTQWTNWIFFCALNKIPKFYERREYLLYSYRTPHGCRFDMAMNTQYTFFAVRRAHSNVISLKCAKQTKWSIIIFRKPLSRRLKV